MTVPVFREDQETYLRPDGMTVIQRRAFCRDFFDYKKGEHVVFGGPSKRGKTTLAFDCLEYITNPDFQAFVAVSKPSDPVTAKRGEELGYRRVSEWPPPKKLGEIFGDKRPPGFLIWPPFGDMETDMERCADITGRLLMDRYAAGANVKKNKGGILVMDDTMVKAKLMGQDGNMVTILAMGGAMGLGLFIFVQKPTDSGRTTLWGYEQSDHLFLTKGGDSQMMKRYIEIIGTKGHIARDVIPTLEPHQFLYVQREKEFMCIVDAKPEGE